MMSFSNRTRGMAYTSLVWAALLVFALVAGCGEATDEDRSGPDLSAFGDGDGKGDLAQQAKLVDDIAPDSVVEGKFDPNVRVYGYTLEAKKGASLDISLTAEAGDDAHGLDEGDQLDTVLAAYSDFEEAGDDADKITQTHEATDSDGTRTVSFDVEEDGTFLIAFMSYEDTGTGNYRLDFGCDGTDLQCQRPDYERPCEEGTHYVQGGWVGEDTEWNSCEVVLLENTIVSRDAIVTIRPGVEVQGNFLDEGHDNRFGDVNLEVRGTIQAGGTEEHPIVFTSKKVDRGWGGIQLDSEDNTFEHVHITDAENAVHLERRAEAEFAHVVIEGDGEHSGSMRLPSRGTIGVLAEELTEATFTRALVKDVGAAVWADETEDLVIKDSVLRDSYYGVKMRGEDPKSECEPEEEEEPPTRTFRDPRIIHSDIVDNTYGIQVQGSNLLVQVEKSNIVDNSRRGFVLEGEELHEDSYLNENNIYHNNGGDADSARTQIRSYHNEGVLTLEDNYWEFISDPDLSRTRDNECEGEISYRGFSPERIEDAGPRPEEVSDVVRESSLDGQ